MTPDRPRGGYITPYGTGASAREGANLGDILERVLDKGIVIAGDIQVNLLDIELLTIKLRLLIVSVETARELGIDWWEHDPWLTGDRRGLEEENRRLRERVADLEEGGHGRRAVDAPRTERERGRLEEGERRRVDPERRRD
ncbi:gas vesicle protein [Actinoallomurus rhizosphaericola]|uniref:gas vesicle protein n=1 Tax=Actinoallomurus rhizosphaericola TaxID=2952536 RepID=UPI0020923CB8|nr:gas vesicle protein [Actinoallomurus rhizosphaericola]MCO5998035.1 gas vesicle protein [Actinoallomurus rhizosphaericola]